MVQVPEGTAMIDTGCRAAVGNTRWHAELQSTMQPLERRFRCKAQEEYFRIGPGDPTRKRWTYEVSILVENKKRKISEVPVECPGLIGPRRADRGFEFWRSDLPYGRQEG